VLVNDPEIEGCCSLSFIIVLVIFSCKSEKASEGGGGGGVFKLDRPCREQHIFMLYSLLQI